jgi:hypothetical protein
MQDNFQVECKLHKFEPVSQKDTHQNQSGLEKRNVFCLVDAIIVKARTHRNRRRMCTFSKCCGIINDLSEDARGVI